MSVRVNGKVDLIFLHLFRFPPQLSLCNCVSSAEGLSIRGQKIFENRRSQLQFPLSAPNKGIPNNACRIQHLWYSRANISLIPLYKTVS